MRITSRSGVFALGAGIAMAVAGAAWAGDPVQCAIYANQAVQQQEQNVANGCGYSGPRWQSSPAPHFAWCLGASSGQINAERNARTNQLALCTGGGGGGGGGGAKKACVWDGPNYTGASVCVNAGMSDSSINPAWNDRVTSLRVYNGATIKLCQNPNYLGFCNTYSSDVPHLGPAMNNKASSYQVW